MTQHGSLLLQKSFRTCAWIHLSLVVVHIKANTIMLQLHCRIPYFIQPATVAPLHLKRREGWGRKERRKEGKGKGKKKKNRPKGRVTDPRRLDLRQHLPNWMNCGSLFTPGPAPVLAATSTLYRIPGTREGMTTEKVEPSTVLFIW